MAPGAGICISETMVGAATGSRTAPKGGSAPEPLLCILLGVIHCNWCESLDNVALIRQEQTDHVTIVVLTIVLTLLTQ